MGGHGSCWVPGPSRPQVSRAGDGPSQVHGWRAHCRGTDWCGIPQVPWQMGLMEERGKGGLELSPQGTGLLWVCCWDHSAVHGPTQSTGLSKAGLLGLGLHPGLQPPAWVPRRPQRHSVRGWLPSHCVCGGREAADLSLHHFMSSQETALNIKMTCAYPPAGPYVSFPFPTPPPRELTLVSPLQSLTQEGQARARGRDEGAKQL